MPGTEAPRAVLTAIVLCGAPAWARPMDPPAPRPDAPPVETVEVEAGLPWDRRRRGAEPPIGPVAGAYGLGGGDLEELPGAAADPARALQLVPGVHAPNLRSTALAIRGAAPDETVWLVDGVPLMSPRSSGLLLSRVDALFIERLTLFAGAQPAELPSSLGGSVAIEPLAPGDQRVESTAEVGPFLARGVVSAPVGGRGSGHGVWLGARRSLLEPSLFALSRVGALPAQTARVQDLAAHARALVAPGVRLRATALVGEGVTGLDAPLDDAGLRQRERTASALAVARVDAQLGARASAWALLGWTGELQRLDLAVDDRRRDARDRWTGRSGVVGRPSGGVALTAGVEVARTGLALEGTWRDPRSRPPFVQVPWRRLAPPLAAADGSVAWTEVAGFASADLGPERARLTPSIRVARAMGRDGAVTMPEPRLAGRLVLPGGWLAMAQGGLLHQLPRDPIDLFGLGAGPLAPSRVAQLDVTLQAPLGALTAVRVDGWARWYDGLPVWSGPGAAAQARGVGSGRGVDGRIVHAAGARVAMVGGGVQHVRRESPIGPLAGVAVEPWWAVPWSAFASASTRAPGRAALDVGATLMIRAGAPEIPIDYEVVDGALVFSPRWGEVARSPVRGRIAARVARRFQLADVVDLTVFADVIVPVGPLGSALVGGAYDPQTGALDPPVVTATRDLPVVPWLGLRARR